MEQSAKHEGKVQRGLISNFSLYEQLIYGVDCNRTCHYLDVKTVWQRHTILDKLTYFDILYFCYEGKSREVIGVKH